MTIGKSISTIAFGAAMALGVAGLASAQTPAAPDRPRAEGAAPERAARADSMRRRGTGDRAMQNRMMQNRMMQNRMMRGQAMAPGRYAPRAEVRRGRMMMERGRMMVQRGQMDRMARMDRMDRMPAAGRARLTADAALMRGVQLTDAQKSSLKALRESYRTRSAELMRAGRPDSAMRAEMARRQRDAVQKGAQLREAHTAEIRALLTPEQQKQFDANRARVSERVERMRERAPQEGRGRITPPAGAPAPRAPGGSL